MRLALAIGVPLLVLVAGWYLLTPTPQQRAVDPAELPWNLSVDDAGRVQAFGLVLDESTLGDSERRFETRAEAGLFVDPGGKRSVEAYYDGLTLAGLRAKLVLELRAEDAELDRLEALATRRVALRSGSVRLELPESAQADLRSLPIRSLTYAPRVNLDEETLLRRFGEPERRVVMDERRSHWLYPSRGLDILVDSDGREILQYLLPGEFDRLLALLPDA